MSELESIAERQRKLTELVWSSIPDPHPASANNEERWQHFVGPALLLKAATTAESMGGLMPGQRAVDSLILLRALYENVVNLAWVAVNPIYRLNRLFTEFHTWHLREHEDWAKAGRPLLSLQEVNESHAWLDAHRTALPHVAEMAKNADRYWGARLAGWHSDASEAQDPRSWSSLRGLYRYVYTRGSQATHSYHRGLDPFITFEDDRCVLHREEGPANNVTWELGLRMLLFGIGPAESTFGWPSYEQAQSIAYVDFGSLDS